MFLDVALSVVAWAAFLGLIIFVTLTKGRWFARRRLASEREGHRLAIQQLQHALQTVAGARLAVVQRVVSRSRQGVRAVLRWETTGIEQELWFAKAWLENGDFLVIAGADLSTGRVELRNILARAAAAPVVES